LLRKGKEPKERAYRYKSDHKRHFLFENTRTPPRLVNCLILKGHESAANIEDEKEQQLWRR
jgi:hypothetical protein